MLTAQKVVVCRELLSEDKAKLKTDTKYASDGAGELVRFWPGVPEPFLDAAKEFLTTYVSAGNPEVVRITGDPSIPGILGDYIWNLEVANGQPVRTNGTYFLKATHHQESPDSWRWAVVDNNNMILFLSGWATDYIAHWADDEDEWEDEWAFEDELGVLEPVGGSPEVPTFVGQTLTMTAAEDHIRVNEYGWIVEDEAATYEVTGDITLEAVVADDTDYVLIKLPYAECITHSGTYYGGEVWVERSKGKNEYGVPDGHWIVYQRLHQWSEAYLLIGRNTPAYFNREIRLYRNVPESGVPTLVNSIADSTTEFIDEVMARKTSREGIYDVYVTVITGLDNDAITVGKTSADYGSEVELLYANVKYSDVTTLVNALAVLGGYAVVDVQSSRTEKAGVFDVRVKALQLIPGAGAIKVGKKVTANTTEETWLHPWVAESALEATVDALAVLSTYAVVNVDARPTRWRTVYDVYVTTLTVNDGGDYLLVGLRSPAFFKRETRLYPRVKQSAVAALVESLATSATYIVEDDTARQTRWDGVFDLYLTLLHVPDDEVSVDVAFELSEGDWGPSVWKFITNYTPQRDITGDVVDYESYRQALPIAHSEIALVRKVTQTSTKSYSKAEPSPAAGSASASGINKTSTFSLNGKKKYRLPNGLWVSESVVTTKGAWGATA